MTSDKLKYIFKLRNHNNYKNKSNKNLLIINSIGMIIMQYFFFNHYKIFVIYNLYYVNGNFVIIIVQYFYYLMIYIYIIDYKFLMVETENARPNFREKFQHFTTEYLTIFSIVYIVIFICKIIQNIFFFLILGGRFVALNPHQRWSCSFVIFAIP